MTGTFHTENWSAKFDAQQMHMFCNFGPDVFSKNGCSYASCVEIKCRCLNNFEWKICSCGVDLVTSLAMGSFPIEKATKLGN